MTGNITIININEMIVEATIANNDNSSNCKRKEKVNVFKKIENWERRIR